MLGLFIEIYRTRRNGDATPKTRRAYAAMEPLLAQMYPATFEYRRIHGDGSETKETCPLFGGLIEAAKFFVDHEDTPDADMPALPDFEPGILTSQRCRPSISGRWPQPQPLIAAISARSSRTQKSSLTQ